MATMHVITSVNRSGLRRIPGMLLLFPVVLSGIPSLAGDDSQSPAGQVESTRVDRNNDGRTDYIVTTIEDADLIMNRTKTELGTWEYHSEHRMVAGIGIHCTGATVIETLSRNADGSRIVQREHFPGTVNVVESVREDAPTYFPRSAQVSNGAIIGFGHAGDIRALLDDKEGTQLELCFTSDSRFGGFEVQEPRDGRQMAYPFLEIRNSFLSQSAHSALLVRHMSVDDRLKRLSPFLRRYNHRTIPLVTIAGDGTACSGSSYVEVEDSEFVEMIGNANLDPAYDENGEMMKDEDGNTVWNLHISPMILNENGNDRAVVFTTDGNFEEIRDRRFRAEDPYAGSDLAR